MEQAKIHSQLVVSAAIVSHILAGFVVVPSDINVK